MCPVEVRVADPERDNVALCELARHCPQGRRWRFFHQRDDYWERCRLHRDSQVLVIDVAGRPAAAATFARKTVWLAGSDRSAVYVFDVMVQPEQRGRGLARRLLHAVRRHNPDAELFYCYILADNRASRHLFEREGFRSVTQALLYHPVLPALERRRLPPGFRRSDSPGDAAAVDDELRRRYDFLDSTGGHDALFVLEEQGGRAWAALRKHEPQVFVGLPWYAVLVGRMLPIVPVPGRPVTVWSLHHMGWQGGGTLRRLVHSVAWLASRSGINVLALPLFENDPLTAVVAPLTLTRWGIPPGRVFLYAAGNLAPLVLRSARPLVLSGQDG